MEVFIPSWHPARINELLGVHWSKAAKRKKSDASLVAHYTRDLPWATGKRRVGLEIILGHKQRAGDPDAYHKSLLDGLVHAHMLIDDNRQHVEITPVVFSRGNPWGAKIALEDVA